MEENKFIQLSLFEDGDTTINNRCKKIEKTGFDRKKSVKNSETCGYLCNGACTITNKINKIQPNITACGTYSCPYYTK